MSKTIHIGLGPVTEVHVGKGDTVSFETTENCTIEFDDASVFGVASAPTKNNKLDKTVRVDHGKTRVTMSARTLGSPTEIIVP